MRLFWFAALALGTIWPQPVRAQATPVSAPELTPIVWQQAVFGSEGSPTPIAQPALVTVQFLTRGKLDVRLTCADASGVYAVDGAHLRIDIASLPAPCASAADVRAAISALTGVTGWRYDGADLVLLAADRPALRLAPSLTGVEWRWQGFRGPTGEAVTPDDPRRYTVTFQPDGDADVLDDCNQAGGRYTAEGNGIRIEVAVMTRVRCAPDSLADEFVAALNESRSFVFRNGRLYLALPMDGGIHEFAPAPIAEKRKANP